MNEAMQTATTVAPRRVTLFELVEEYERIFAEIDDAEGEVTEEVGARLDALAASLDLKAEAYAAIINIRDAQAKATAELAKRYAERAARKAGHVAALKARLKLALEAAGKKKIETPTATVAIQANGQASLEIIGAVPAEYLKPGEPDNAKIRAAIAADAKSVAFAKLVKGDHLRVR